MRGRIDAIRRGLDQLKDAGVVHVWYAYNPDGRRRWVVAMTGGMGERVMGTREAEQFVKEHAA